MGTLITRGLRAAAVALAALGIVTPLAAAEAEIQMNLVFSCEAENDLYRILSAGGTQPARYESALEAIRSAPEGAGVLLLASRYPVETTAIDPAAFDLSAEKKLRLYVEYPESLPDLKVGKPRRLHLERAVVTSDAFGESLEKGRLAAIHDGRLVEVKGVRSHLVAAKVAGFDGAIFGIDDVKTYPLLFEHPRRAILVSTTKLSQFVTARYGPQEALQAIWTMVFRWLQPGVEVRRLHWIPTVRPTYGRMEKLPPDAVRQAIIRGIDWHTRARMLIHPSWKDEYERRRRDGEINPANPVGTAPDLDWPSGDGEHGVLEGFSSRILHDGKQPARWWLRSDSNGESSLAFALRARIDGDPRSRRIAANLLDWVYFRSGLFQDEPTKANYGLIHWAPDSTALYGDNDVKAILGCMGTAALLNSCRWDEVLLKNILGNYRTTGIYGFRGAALNNQHLLRRGWQHFWRGRIIHYAPHYQAWIWATYLWLYHKTGYEPLLERTRKAIEIMMNAYPDDWRWTNGIQQERGRMLLTLAWLIRVDDKPRHRAWLKRMAVDMQRCQDSSGAIREELGTPGLGTLRPPNSNAEYGSNEASLIQQNGDPVADLLYTSNFAFLGLNEAAAATGEPLYREIADRLEEFLLRVQIRSDAHAELDGAWYRAFDFRRWEYWGSNADNGWGAWSIEVGWTQAWIPTVLAMRELEVNLWDLTAKSKIAAGWEKVRKQMLPDSAFEGLELTKLRHGAVGKPVVLAARPDPRYPSAGGRSLTDGLLGPYDYTSGEWLGFHGDDIEATIDLGQEVAILELAARFLQSTAVGIFLPPQVEVHVSDDGKEFRRIATMKHNVPLRDPGPKIHDFRMQLSNVQARHIRLRATNIKKIPDWHPAAGKKAWLFVDEIILQERKR